MVLKEPTSFKGREGLMAESTGEVGVEGKGKGGGGEEVVEEENK